MRTCTGQADRMRARCWMSWRSASHGRKRCALRESVAQRPVSTISACLTRLDLAGCSQGRLLPASLRRAPGAGPQLRPPNLTQVPHVHACRTGADARHPLTIPQLHNLPAHARLPHCAPRRCLRGHARARCRRWAWRSKPSRAGWRAPARSCCRGGGLRSPPGRGRPRASPAARPRRPRGPRIALLRQKCSPQAMSRRSRVSQRARAQHPGPRCPVEARNQWQPATPRAGAPATCWTLTGARPL